MNLKDLHKKSKVVSLIPHFKAVEGNVLAIQILFNQLLTQHKSIVPALLICVEGEAIYEEEHGVKIALKPGDFVNIEPHVKHWISGKIDCQLILIK